MTASPLERVLARVEKIEAGCWLWTGAKNDAGYGQIRINNRIVYVHRWAYEHFVGPIPHGLVIDHVKARGCTSRSCCNPEHLEPVTQRENFRRAPNWESDKTHCPQGHPYDEANTTVYKRAARPESGRARTTVRLCRACKRDQYRRGR